MIQPLTTLNMSLMQLHTIVSFHNNGIINVLPPLHEDVFSSELLKSLNTLFTKLYARYTIESCSPFFIRFGRAGLCGQVIGSVVNATSSNSSSVITAHWPGRDMIFHPLTMVHI